MNFIFCLITDILNPLFTFLYEYKLATDELKDCKYKIFVGSNQIEKYSLNVNYYTSIINNQKNSYWIPSEMEDVHLYSVKIKEIFSIIFKDLEKEIIYKHFDILLHEDEIDEFLKENRHYYAYIEQNTLYLLNGCEIFSFNIEQKKINKVYFTKVMNILKDKVIKKYFYEDDEINSFIKKTSSILGVDSMNIKLFLLNRHIFIMNE